MSENRRKHMTAGTKRAVVDRQNHKCNCGCGATVVIRGKPKTVFNHNPPLELRPLNDAKTDTIPPSNSIDHIEALTFLCDKAVTSGDLTRIGKMRRQSLLGTVNKMPPGERNAPSKYRMQSRGFDKTKTKRMDGSVVDRTQKRPR